MDEQLPTEDTGRELQVDACQGGSLECRMRHWHLESLEDDRHASEPQIDVYPNDQCKTKQLKECFDACKG